MSSNLITQLVEDKPRVLLISPNSSLSASIAAFYSRQGLEVENLTTQDLQTKEGLEKKRGNFYKIIVLGSSDWLRKVLPQIEGLNNLLVINLVSSLEKNFNAPSVSNLVIGLDVVPQSEDTWPIFEKICEKIESGILLDPQIKVFLQSEKAFLNEIKKYLLSPGGERVIIRGGKHSCEAITSEIKRLFKVFFNSDLAIKQYPYQQIDINQSNLKQVDSDVESLPSLLETSVILRHKAISQTTPKRSEIPEKFHKDIPEPIFEKSFAPRVEEIEKKPPIISPVVTPVITPPQSKNPSTVDEKLNKIFKNTRVDTKVKMVEKKVKETKKIKKKTKKKKTLFWIGLIFTVLASVAIVFVGIIFATKFGLERQLKSTFSQISKEDGVVSEEDNKNSQKNEDQLQKSFSKIKKYSGILETELNIIGFFVPAETMVETEALVEISQQIVKGYEAKNRFDKAISEKVMLFLGKDLIQDKETAQNISKVAQEYYESVSILLSRLYDLEQTENNLEEKEQLSEFISFVERQRTSLVAYQQLSPVLSSLLGENGKKTYAVVLQNNHELRPTGGFIQSVALVTVDQGMIVDYQAFSSYDLDKNLGGSVIPPDDVITLLGENFWYLRDSNWDPDFKKSGRQIAWFLEQETNRKIDGVIGINLFVIQDLLSMIGPLELNKYNEVITDKNIFERSEFHSEIKLIDAKNVEDYHTELLGYLLADVVSKGQVDPSPLLKALSKSVKEKQLLVYMSDQEQESAFSTLGWAGEIVVPECPTQFGSQPCHIDSLAVNEANIGVNKANYHTKRRDEHQITIQNNFAKHTRTILLKNSALSNAWPKGQYKSYFRFYLPQSVESVELLVDGQKIPEENYQILEGTVTKQVGIVVEVPISSEKSLELNYIMPIENSSPFSYVFFNQKQPGTKNTLEKIEIFHEPELSPALIAPQAEVAKNSILFDDLKDDHSFVGVSFK